MVDTSGWILSVGLGSFLADDSCGCSFDGLDEFVAVPDLEDLCQDVDVDASAFAVFADGDLLPGHGDDAIDEDLPGDPFVGVAGVVKGHEVGVEVWCWP